MPNRHRVALLALVLAVVGYAGLNGGAVATARAALAAETEKTVALADRDDVIMRRIVIKESLADDVVAGRAALPAVAARFLDLGADDPAYLGVLRSSVRGDSDLERAARNVVDYAAARVADPAARAALRARLEAELDRLQDADHPAAR